jgi:hypothetical protein
MRPSIAGPTNQLAAFNLEPTCRLLSVWLVLSTPDRWDRGTHAVSTKDLMHGRLFRMHHPGASHHKALAHCRQDGTYVKADKTRSRFTLILLRCVQMCGLKAQINVCCNAP